MRTANDGNMLALDVGERRIGVAVANRIARLPRPLKTLQNNESVFDELADLVKSEQAGTVIVGLPRGLEGQETAQTKEVRKFGEVLEQKLGVPIHWQDEALTSRQAETELSARHKAYDKGMIDALAATYILEDYLLDNFGKASHE